MLYLNSSHLDQLDLDWNEVIAVIKKSVETMSAGDYAQPLKPYLRYGDPKNRIIAMPAYVGGDVSLAGIKWIASFPDNIKEGIPRAHAVTVLNDSQTGIPVCIINTPLLSGVRTAAVSGLMISEYNSARALPPKLTIGIIGYGPIGRLHSMMAASLLTSHLQRILIYDIKRTDLSAVPDSIREKVEIAETWEEVYDRADMLITCTVAHAPYIHCLPKKNSLHLNVSLRDYGIEALKAFDLILVDSWEEVCRENTNVEHLYNQAGLRQEDVLTINDVVGGALLNYNLSQQAVIFNPMGLAAFDIAAASYFYKRARAKGVGVDLN